MSGYEVRLGRASNGSNYVPKVGEIIMYDDGVNWTARIGDGKTQAKDLPPLLNYDIFKKVADLEKEVEQLKLIIFQCMK